MSKEWSFIGVQCAIIGIAVFFLNLKYLFELNDLIRENSNIWAKLGMGLKINWLSLNQEIKVIKIILREVINIKTEINHCQSTKSIKYRLIKAIEFKSKCNKNVEL